MPEPSVLVFGATGSLGRHVLNALVDRGTAPESVTAAGRNRARLGELASAGFNTAAVDLSDAASVDKVVARHSDIVLISGSDPNRLAQHASVIQAATNAGVQHVYYTSGVRADDARFEINTDHRATEDALRASGLTYTILRNTWYIENYIQSMAGPRRAGILAEAAGQPGRRRRVAASGSLPARRPARQPGPGTGVPAGIQPRRSRRQAGCWPVAAR